MRPPCPRTGIAAAALLLLGGCVNLAPSYERPPAPLPQHWPEPAAANLGLAAAALPAAATATVQPADVEWRDFITDARLERVVALGLQNNRDLRVAVLSIEQARALYRIERAARLPEIGAAGAVTRARTPSTSSDSDAGGSSTTTQYSVELGLASYEIDVFGRVRNLSESALQNFFAVEANRRATQVSLIAELANAWLTLAADTELLRLARDTLASQQASYELTRRTRELGGASGLALAQARTTVDTARVDVARFATAVAQDRHVLELLAGSPLPDEWLPARLAEAAGAVPGGITAGASTGTAEPATARPLIDEASLLLDVPAGLPSEVLLRRPDVSAAERVLRAANADIGVARAALFPSITLTASAGTRSRSLQDLFASGSFAWSIAPRIDLPIFDAGRRRANVAFSEAQQQIELANYERTLQVAFREVSDALAARGTLAEQLDAQRSLVEATQQAYSLSDSLFKNGASSFLEVLDAQRALVAARQTAITLRLAEQSNRIALYRTLGGGWSTGEPEALASSSGSATIERE